MIKSILTVALALTSTAAFAQPGNDVRVGYGDLDLTSSQGQTILMRRLAAASQEVCGDFNRGSSVEKAEARNCNNVLYRNARKQAQVAIARRTDGRALAAK